MPVAGSIYLDAGSVLERGAVMRLPEPKDPYQEQHADHHESSLSRRDLLLHDRLLPPRWAPSAPRSRPLPGRRNGPGRSFVLLVGREVVEVLLIVGELAQERLSLHALGMPIQERDVSHSFVEVAVPIPIVDVAVIQRRPPTVEGVGTKEAHVDGIGALASVRATVLAGVGAIRAAIAETRSARIGELSVPAIETGRIEDEGILGRARDRGQGGTGNDVVGAVVAHRRGRRVRLSGQAIISDVARHDLVDP